MLSVASSDCTLQTPFEYYVEPEIMGVFPRQGPRYGSFQLMVDLGAKADLASLNWVGPPLIYKLHPIEPYRKGHCLLFAFL